MGTPRSIVLPRILSLGCMREEYKCGVPSRVILQGFFLLLCAELKVRVGLQPYRFRGRPVCLSKVAGHHLLRPDLAFLPVQLKVSGTYATSRFTQLVALARKFRLAYWRSPSYNLMRMLMTLLICLFYGTVFWGRGRLPSEGAYRCYAVQAWSVSSLHARDAAQPASPTAWASGAAASCPLKMHSCC